MRRRQAGQATVELALALPFVAMAMLLVVQVLLVARGQLMVEHAAIQAGRAAAVDPDPVAATLAATRVLDQARTSVEVTETGRGLVTVVITHRFSTDVPIVGAMVPDLTLEAESSFRVEWLPSS